MREDLNNGFVFVGLFFGALLLSSSVSAQTQDEVSTEKDAVYGEGVDVLFSHTSGAHVFAHTQGAGVGFRYGVFLTAKTSRSLGCSLLYLRHEKEEKTYNPVYVEGLPYVLGKVNSFMIFRVYLESRRELTPKLRKGAVQVESVFRYGASLGLEKPVYLVIGYPEIPYEIFVDEPYDPIEHFYNDIYGRSSWVNGLDEMSVVPGVNASYGLTFEYGNERAITRSVEVGATIDVFMRPVEIMAAQFVDRQFAFLNLYLKLGVGSKWTQAR
tara:strand:- start:1541 stop:2347 length:807 start_codon:yes stop_codon:yes gene_type:complete